MLRRSVRILAVLFACALAITSGASRAQAQSPAPAIVMSVSVDARHVTQGVLHVSEQIAVHAGDLTLEYPEWIPGEHMPAGPIVDLSGLVISAGATPLRWLRDLIDPYAFHIDVPPGTSSIDVRFDFLGASVGRYSSNRLASANMLVLTWNKVLLTPSAADYHTIQIAPSVMLPGPDWQYATALDTATHDGAELTFKPLPMDQLVDSPLDAGINMKRWPLGSIDGAPVDIAVFADTPDELAGDAVIPKLAALVTQVGRLYRARHFDHYTFLLTVSDILATEGVEHHQSSDLGAEADLLIDSDRLLDNADLIPHEFIHSWNGKYRRPAGLATPNLRVPMKDDLLWVYEGMTQFYGNLAAARAGLLTPANYRDHLADTYAALDSTTGRATTPLYDTAANAPVLYNAPPQFEAARRSDDFYSEGELMWLEADTIIRKASGGKRSIDDFARAFFGRTSSGPIVVPYTRADVIAALASVQRYDWAAFFDARVDAIAPHPPDPFTAAGWRVTFAATPSAWQKAINRVHKDFTARYSLGIVGGEDGVVADVIDGSPARRAGLTPGDTIEGVMDRKPGKSRSLQDLLDAALVAAAHGGPSVQLLVLGGGTYHEIVLPYTGGPRYPVLEPISGAPDMLDTITKPLGL